MIRVVKGIVLALGALVVMAGCATAPRVSKSSPNYLQTGMVSARFRGNEFYMVIGEVDLYQYDVFGNLAPSGQTVEIAAAVQADQDTGEILRIATLQPEGSQLGVTVTERGPQVLSNLRGGISVIDDQPYPHWLDAIQAMRDAIGKLHTYTQFAFDSANTAVAVVVEPRWPWWHHRRWW